MIGGTGRPLTELDDRWLLPFRGLTVTQVLVDSALGLNLADQGMLRIDGTAALGWSDRGTRPETVELHPRRQDVAGGLALFNTTVLSAVAFKSGALRFVFSGAHRLEVAPDAEYEAWTVTGPDGMLVVCQPGGGLAVWPSRPFPHPAPAQ